MSKQHISSPPVPSVNGVPYDPLDEQQVKQPWEWLKAARSEAPVFYYPPLDIWFVTRYEDIIGVLKDTDTFSNRGNITLKPFSPLLQEVYPNGHPSDRALTRMDPPDHTRVRKLVGKVLVPKVVNALEGKVRERCHNLIDSFIRDGQCDFVSQFAARLPVQVILDFVGAPLEMESDAIHFGQDFKYLLNGGPPLTPEIEREIAERGRRITRWMQDFIDERRAEDKGDLISALIRATGDEGEPLLSNQEIMSTINSFFVAGHETTANLLSLAMYEILKHPDQWNEVKNNKALAANVIEETLRFWSPSRSFSRKVVKDTVIAGVAVPAGSQVQLSIISGNHDEAVFEDPDTFNIHRQDASKHLAFGHGIHYCIGALLSKLEGRVALETIIERIPDIRRAAEADDEWVPHLLFPRPKSLRLEWN